MKTRVTTLWFLETESPVRAIRDNSSDPGFARRLLSRLYPKATITSLGAFPLNRSASAGSGEIYIGSYPGVTVVQSCEPEPILPSAIDSRWLGLVATPVVLAFTFDPETGISGFGRWENDRLIRSFSASGDRIAEDEGIPQPLERSFWAGEYPPDDRQPDNPLALPFDPAVLVRHAQREWLGFELTPDSADLEVHGFATDGRREVRQHRSGKPGAHVGPGAARAEQFGGRRDSDAYYDDYERIDGGGTNKPPAKREQSPLAEVASHARSAFGALQRKASEVAERLSGHGTSSGDSGSATSKRP